ncbi:hypothetical protein JCM8547_001731 [Rhodosporidiobolus lusitaniae]
MGNLKKPGQTLPTPKHSVPVTNSLSTPPTVPPLQRNVQVRSLSSTPAASPPPLPPQQVAARRKKKKQQRRQRQEDEEQRIDDSPVRSRIIKPGQGQQPQARTLAKLPRVAQAAVPSTSAAPASARLPPRPVAAPQKDEYVEVTGEGGEIVLTRPRSDALNESIKSILGPRPSEVLEQHDREVRTKKQKLSAKLLKKEMMMEVDEAEGAGGTATPEVDTGNEADEECGGEENEEAEEWRAVVGKIVDEEIKSKEGEGEGKKEDGGDGMQEDGKDEKQEREDRNVLPNVKKEQLVPMAYQKALIERAKVGNVITVLQTGAGKTFVAIHLINWVHFEVEKKRQEEGKPKRMQFFLTQSVPLVHQQANVLAHNTSLRVGTLFGALNVNLCSAIEWKYNHEHFDILFVTAQLLLDSLAHGFIKMEQIALIVLDEAHHAKCNHPFAVILRDFYHRTPVEERPRILGLTASPLKSSKSEGVQEAKKLEGLFDAKLVTAPPETREELESFVAKPNTMTIEFEPSPSYSKTPLYEAVLDKAAMQDDGFKRYLESADRLLQHYGPKAYDLVWHVAFRRYKAKYIPLGPSPSDDEEDDPRTSLFFRRSRLEHHARIEENKKARKKEKKESNSRELEKLKTHLPVWMKEVEAHKPTCSFEQFSPKLKKLIEVLREFPSDPSQPFCGIVFVERRIDALILAEMLKEMARQEPDKLGWLRIDCVAGHGAGKGKNIGPRMQWKEQADVLTPFANGEVNLLIATSVVEEGLDVQPCNFIIRLYYNLSYKRKLHDIARSDAQIGALLQRFDDEDDDPEDFYGAATEDIEYFTNEQTGATITAHFALSLLQRFCRSLPKSDEFSINGPVFNLVRVVKGPRVTSPKVAKRLTAFWACKFLYAAGQLDDHFLPHHVLPAVEQVDATGAPIGSKRHTIEYERAFSRVWQPNELCGELTTLFATLLHFPGENGTTTWKGEVYRPVINIFVEGDEFPTSATSFGSIVVSVEQRAVLTIYTIAMFSAVLNKGLRVACEDIGEGKQEVLEFVYFVAELLPEAKLGEGGLKLEDLAWESMQKTKETRVEYKGVDPDVLEANLEDRVVVDFAKNHSRYFFHSVRADLHAQTKFTEPNRQTDKAPGIDNLLDYYLVFNDRFFHEMKVDMEQPLLQVGRLSKSVSFLSRTSASSSTPNQKRLRQHLPRFEMPQCYRVLFLPASIWRTGYMIPSILTDLDQSLLVDELNETTFDSRLDHEYLKTALTTPSAGLDQSYQRLELLGSSFLKLCCSLHIFVTNDRTMHERNLHRVRMKIVSNAALCEGGSASNLPPISSPDLSPLANDRRCGRTGGRAAIETRYGEEGGGSVREAFELGLMAAKALHVKLDSIPTWSDFAKLYGAPGPEVPVAAELRPVEEALGYVFKHSGVVQEALTHPSKMNNVSFERREWLGDAVLDFPVLRWGWKKWSELSEGHLTELKGAVVSNETLAALAVHLGLDRYLIYCLPFLFFLFFEREADESSVLPAENDTLAVNLAEYRKRVVAACVEEMESAKRENRQPRPYWLTLDPPKASADIVESLFGAIFIDSGFDPAATQAAFDHCLAPFMETFVNPSSLHVDTIWTLLELAQKNGCDDFSHVSSTLDTRTKPETGELIPKLSRVCVVAHKCILSSCYTANPKTAKKIASSRALEKLEQNRGFFSHFCNCPDRREIARELAAEEHQRKVDEGLVSEPDSSDEEAEQEEVIAAGEVGMEVDGA